MKKNIVSVLLNIFLIVLIAACSANDEALIDTKDTRDILKTEQGNYEINKTKTNTQESNISSTDMESNDDLNWQQAYILFLHEFVILEDFEICQYALRDINSDKIPELILIQSDLSAKALLEIYMFKDGVFKTGEYTDAKIGVSALRVSDSPLHPGLFNLWWSGGVEHYGYIAVLDELLIYEYLWFNNLAPEEVSAQNGLPGENLVSDNKVLIERSKDVYSDFERDNMLEMFTLGVVDYEDIINNINN